MSKRSAQELSKQQIGWAEVLTCEEMRAIESAAMSSGEVTGLELMERAGAAVAGHIRLRWPKAGRATVLCGPGNNGGDGYVIARLLAQAGWDVRVLGLDNTPGLDAAEMKRRWSEMGEIAPLTERELRGHTISDVYVDAIFGIGLTRAPQGEIANILAQMRGRNGDVGYYAPRTVAVDGPSGLCLDSGRIIGAEGEGGFAQPVRMTVTFDRPKVGHLIAYGPQVCGELVAADIGLAPWREMANPRRIEGRWCGPLKRMRLAQAVSYDTGWHGAIFGRSNDIAKPRGAGVHNTIDEGLHKFSYGHAVVVGGGQGKGGAARLSARAALRVGAGLVTLAPTSDALIEHAGQPDALMRRGIDSAAELSALLEDQRITAVALGPGCGVDRAAELLDPLLAVGRPCVLDADALTALAGRGFDGLTSRCVLTPHGGEFARLFPDLAERLADGTPYSKLDATREAAARCGAVVLFKGPDTVIADPMGIACIHSAFDVPWLATAGAGDALTGIIVGLLARGLLSVQAAGMGACLHAMAARRFGPGLIADELPDQLPKVFRDLGL